MSYLDDRKSALLAAADALDDAETKLKRARSYGLPRGLDRNVRRILKALNASTHISVPTSGYDLKRRAERELP